jgi:hypothetical protein
MTATMPALVTTRVMTLSNSDRASIWYQLCAHPLAGSEILKLCSLSGCLWHIQHVTGSDSYGRVLFGAFEPVYQHDFGCGGSVIGGGPSLKKAGPDPVGEIV